jgi:hypothetical protein
LQPSYDAVHCTLEPDPDFYGGTISTGDIDCSSNIDYYNATTKIWNCPWDVNSLSNWLTTDGFKIVVDTSLVTASAEVFEVYTIFKLWCACTGTTYTQYSYTSAEFFFQILPSSLTSVTSTEFSSTYTFNVGVGGMISFPTFTTVPSQTTYLKTKFGLLVDGTALSTSGTTVSSLSWLAYDTTKFTISSLTSIDVGIY